MVNALDQSVRSMTPVRLFCNHIATGGLKLLRLSGLLSQLKYVQSMYESKAPQSGMVLANYVGYDI